MNYSMEATNELQWCLKSWKANSYFTNASYALNVLEELCRKGADLNHLEKERDFALIPNVFLIEKLIKFFVDRGCDVNAGDENGDTALHLAIRHTFFDLD